MIDKTLTTGLTDLGRENTRTDYPCCSDSKASQPKEIKYTEYPHFCVRGNDDLLATPDGEFYAIVKLKKGEFSKRKDWEDPTKTIAEVEFDILAIKHLEELAQPKVAVAPKIDFSSLQSYNEDDSVEMAD